MSKQARPLLCIMLANEASAVTLTSKHCHTEILRECPDLDGMQSSALIACCLCLCPLPVHAFHLAGICSRRLLKYASPALYRMMRPMGVPTTQKLTTGTPSMLAQVYNPGRLFSSAHSDNEEHLADVIKCHGLYTAARRILACVISKWALFLYQSVYCLHLNMHVP